MAEASKREKVFYLIGTISGILAIIACLVTLGLSATDTYVSVYVLATAIVLLSFNRLALLLSDSKKHGFASVFWVVYIFALAVLVCLTKFNIYYLISSMFGASLLLMLRYALAMKKDNSTQSMAFNILSIIFYFLFSFVFFFPAIYEKHASSVSNSNFIIMCYATMIIVSSGKNLVFLHDRRFNLNLVSKILKKSLAGEILLGLGILIILCSVYFTLAEPRIISYVNALWYTFSVITTIGFGDVSVNTTLGRILSVILGISGIAVVAVFTSFIVNFYNEMNKKREDKAIQKLIKETKELEKLQEEIREESNKAE